MAVKIYDKTDRSFVAQNFRVNEFSCHGKGCCSTVKIDPKLAEYVQKIRDHFGKPVTISSGYRCPTHNRAVDGASKSRHVEGMAADIKVKDVAPAEVAKYAESIGVKGIGLYETDKDGYFVHIDTRTIKAFWYGKGQAYRSTFGGKAGNDTEKDKADSAESYSLTQFIKDVQAACGAVADGIAGPETLSKTVTLSAKKNAAHKAVKAVQRRLLSLGYAEAGNADGIAGVKFTSAVAHFQQDNSCVVDGVITAKGKTWRKLLGMK